MEGAVGQITLKINRINLQMEILTLEMKPKTI
jgi:hypothetical protein